jgi:hypothetical protein
MAGGNDTPPTMTNTRYERAWSLGGSIDDRQRSVRVQVAWKDRTGAAQTLTLDSVIAKVNPADVGAISVPTPAHGILRRPNGRDINVPVPAIRLGGINSGKSKIQWTGASVGWLVFSNGARNVAYKCTSEPTDSTDLAASCATSNSYLLSGYISGAISSSAAASNYNGLSIGGDSTIFASLDISFASPQYISGAPECVRANAVDQSTGAAIAGYIAYMCLIAPTDHDGNPATAKVWSGRVNVTPSPTGASQVCRYTTGPGLNPDHPAAYSLISESLDNQSFYLIASGACPSTPTDPTVQHQP